LIKIDSSGDLTLISKNKGWRRPHYEKKGKRGNPIYKIFV